MPAGATAENGHTAVRIPQIHPGVCVINPIGALSNRIVGLVRNLRMAAAAKWKHNRQHTVVTAKSSKLCPKVNPRQLIMKRNLLNTLPIYKRSLDFHRRSKV